MQTLFILKSIIFGLTLEKEMAKSFIVCAAGMSIPDFGDAAVDIKFRSLSKGVRLCKLYFLMCVQILRARHQDLTTVHFFLICPC